MNAFSFVFALLAIRIAVAEWRRNRKSMYKYLAISFGIMLIQFLDAALLLSYSARSHNQYAYTLLPILDHILRTFSYIYLAAAFITSGSGSRPGFIKANLAILFVLGPISLISWTVPFVGLPSLHLIQELVFDTWDTGLLLYTIMALTGQYFHSRKEFVTATTVLGIIKGIHFYNLYRLVPQPSLTLILEPVLVLLFFLAVLSTLHNKIVSDLAKVDTEKNTFKEKASQDIIRALVNSLEAKDEYTRGHSDRVTEYAMVIGAKLGLPAKEMANLYYGAILHDIGKIGINEDILNNPLSLCHDDYASIKKHPEIGSTIVSSVESLKDIAPAILYHHERFDGSGYPAGLKGTEIPLHARIIAISDALDAMSSTRSYRTQLPQDHVISELISGAGTQFDPVLVKTFIDALGVKLNESDYRMLSRSA